MQPKIPKRRGELGEGIVVSKRKTRLQNVSVVFPTTDGVFRTYDFTDERLEVVEAPFTMRTKMDKIAREYNQLMGALLSI